MSESVSLSTQQGVSVITGSLIRSTVPSLGKDCHIKLVKENKSLQLDLNGVNKVDTAGLAWLLLVLEYAKKHQCKLSFAHVPNDLLKLAQLSAVEHLLIES